MARTDGIHFHAPDRVRAAHILGADPAKLLEVAGNKKAPRSRGFLTGAPRFELGTSPTRTVRATRLRHAPKSPQYHTRPAHH